MSSTNLEKPGITENNIRVVIADDYEVVRCGVLQILAEAGDIRVTGEAATGQAALQAVQAADCDVLVLDLSLPDMNGMEVLRLACQHNPDLPVLVYSLKPEEQYAIRALQMGAAGYLSKGCRAGELVSAIRRVAAGGRYVSQAVAEKLAGRVCDGHSQPEHEQLSDREFQVLTMLAEGKTVGAIAEDLALSVKSISTYRTRILAKLGLSSTAEIISYAFRHGLAT